MSTTDATTDEPVEEAVEVTRFACRVAGCDVEKSSKDQLREHLISDHPFDARLDTGVETVEREIVE